MSQSPLIGAFVPGTHFFDMKETERKSQSPLIGAFVPGQSAGTITVVPLKVSIPSDRGIRSGSKSK